MEMADLADEPMSKEISAPSDLQSELEHRLSVARARLIFAAVIGILVAFGGVQYLRYELALAKVTQERERVAEEQQTERARIQRSELLSSESVTSHGDRVAGLLLFREVIQQAATSPRPGADKAVSGAWLNSVQRRGITQRRTHQTRCGPDSRHGQGADRTVRPAFWRNTIVARSGGGIGNHWFAGQCLLRAAAITAADYHRPCKKGAVRICGLEDSGSPLREAGNPYASLEK
jgi:hypothetical protein